MSNSNGKLWLVALAIFLGALLIAVPLFMMSDAPIAQGITGSGVTNFTNIDASGYINYGSNDLYPLGYASDGQQVVVGTDLITGTATAAHGLTTVTFCLCTLGEDPETGAGDAAACTTAVATNVCTVKAWQDDFTAATETDVVVHWLVVGTP